MKATNVSPGWATGTAGPTPAAGLAYIIPEAPIGRLGSFSIAGIKIKDSTQEKGAVARR